MDTQFPKLFKQYYAIHETIYALLGEDDGAQPDMTEIERRVRELYPELAMEPAMFDAAIRQALKDARVPPR